MTSIKYDTEKLQWDLLPFDAIEEVVKVLTFGAKKYTPDGWKFVPDKERRYYAALLRHIAAHQKGEMIDPESNIGHLAHVACNAIFLLWFELNKEKEKIDE
jgi:hypothetical protein